MTIIVLGGINEDVVAQVATLPRRGETVPALQVLRSAGGKGLNQAMAAARQGGAMRMVGAVGDDAAGASLRAVMVRAGIDTGGVVVASDRPTGQAMIALTPAGDNTIIVDTGANAACGAAEVDRALAGIGSGEEMVALTQFEAQPDAIKALFRHPALHGGIRILNAAPAIEAGRPLLPLADIVVLNETELQVFARWPQVPAAEDIGQAARRLLTRPGQGIVVTLGHLGCLLVDRDGEIAVAGVPMRAIDTIGAGDCFCGVLAAALATGTDIAGALRRANAAAAISVTRRGAGEAAPYPAEVDALLATLLA